MIQPRVLRTLLSVLCLRLFAGCAVSWAEPTGLPAGVVDTQKPGDKPLPPAEAARRITVPPGFELTLFAGEPDVLQPIAMTFDDRGRLWVVECFSYPEFKFGSKDRVLILTDKDGDGRFDERKVFWDQGDRLTGIAVGFGGVWLTGPPKMLFLPDANGDDKPDGPPVTKLDGWTLEAKHNWVNGLAWGPDGWLYGRHGITDESRVGKPGDPDSARTRLNCSIWRYHPITQRFEVVTNGTTNPWGLDWDEHGQAFFTNNVIGHLWHVIPGAHYKRMFGEDYNPHFYQLMDQCADHLHWAGDSWTDSRGGVGIHGELGGGHSHCGAMIYLGDNWPSEYRGRIFMNNIHGNRVNCDRLERSGSGFVAHHGADFLRANDPWFRGVGILYGPDGGVYVSDWNDLGECHDDDGAYRSSGRIYKITFGKPKKLDPFDLTRMSGTQLAELQRHPSEWWARRARRVLQERLLQDRGRRDGQVFAVLNQMLAERSNAVHNLRAMWTLHALELLDHTRLMLLLFHDNEHVRWWAVQLLCADRQPSSDALAKFAAMARTETSPLVRLSLASALQRMPLAERWPIAEALLSQGADHTDQNLPLMTWYGIEQAVADDSKRGIALLGAAQIPQVRQFIARRLAHMEPAGLVALLEFLRDEHPTRTVEDTLQGMTQALRGRRNVRVPGDWSELFRNLRRSPSTDVQLAAHVVGLVLGDRGSNAEVQGIAFGDRAPVEDRERALRALADARMDDLVPRFFGLLGDTTLRRATLRALATFDNEAIPKAILEKYPTYDVDAKRDAVSTLASRPAYALALLDAVERSEVPSQDVSAFVIRQMVELKDKRVAERVRKVWGEIRTTPQERRNQIARYKNLLTNTYLASADLANGRAIFKKTCQSCHRLFGEGEKIGPDLTGGNRNNLDYVLENVVDPSATVARDYRISTVLLHDGRVLSGVVQPVGEATIAVQTATERLVLPKSDVEKIQPSSNSLMPEGAFDKLAVPEIRDLVAYLRAQSQVPLGTEAGSP